MGTLGRAKRALLAPLRMMDIAIIRQSSLDNLRGHAADLRAKIHAIHQKEFLEAMPPENRERLIELMSHSKAQHSQDLMVLSELNFKEEGYFVEFGACAGMDLSNTFLLERRFGWKGILAEPCRTWHDDLRQARRANISTKCVWSRSGEKLRFKQTRSPWIATIEAFGDSDHLADRRKAGRTYEVETISLIDLLAEFNAPRDIEYLSIDTEGSEFEILKAFDFSKYRFQVITVEHNHMPVREDIHALLKAYGYVRKYEEVSGFDDWYVLRG